MKLSKNDINMIKGIANYYANHYERAISYLEKCSTNAYACYLMASSYYSLRKYAEAAKYAQLSAEKGYTKAYHLASNVLTSNLEQHDKAYDFLKKGIENRSAHACIAMLSFYLYRRAFWQEEPSLSEYEDVLKKAWRYAKSDEKCYISNNITYIYRALRRKYNRINENIANKLKEKELKYALIANEYGSGVRPEYGNADLSELLNDNVSSKDKRAILNSLYDHFDGVSALLLGLLLVQNSHRKVRIEGEPWMLFTYGTKIDNVPCALMYALLYGSHLPKSEFDPEAIRRLFKSIDPHKTFFIPPVVNDTFLTLLDSYDPQFESEITDIKRRIYASE